MDAKLIVMLTHHDVTVDHAFDLFESCKDLPIKNWGFKNVGMSEKEREQLALAMRAANKEVYIEDVLNEEEDVLKMAMFAVKNGIGNIFARYYPSVHEYIKGKGVRYYACSTKSSGIPVMLRGSVDEIIEQLQGYIKKGIDGVCIGAYRHETDPHGLLKALAENIDGKVIIAGSIDSQERIREVNALGCYGFTMGSAFFDKKYAPEGTFRENLIALLCKLKNLE